MKIKDLFNLEQAIHHKNIELRDKKQELEKLQKEAEELKLMIQLNQQENNTDMIDISNVKVANYYGKICFVLEEERKAFTGDTLWYSKDLFSGKELFWKYKHPTFMGEDYIYMVDDGKREEVSIMGPIEAICPEVNCYFDRKVPKLLLQKLYYEMNHIDEKILEKAIV